MNTLEKRLIALQQQLEKLTSEVANLAAFTSAYTTKDRLGLNMNKPLVKRSITNTPTSTVGLNRFRQLVKEQA